MTNQTIYEPDLSQKDSERIPLTIEDNPWELITPYIEKEVLPHWPDAWPEPAKARLGFEINFNRYFYVYEPLRSLDEINTDLRILDAEIRKGMDELLGGLSLVGVRD